MAVVIFHKKLFLTPKIEFLCFAAKTIEPPWRRHTHAPKLVSPVINLYHQGLKLVQSTASALNCIYDFLGGGCTTPPIPTLPGPDVSQRRVNGGRQSISLNSLTPPPFGNPLILTNLNSVTYNQKEQPITI